MSDDDDDVSTGKSIVRTSNGVPAQKITDGKYAPEGTKWDNSTYAVVLSTVGHEGGLTLGLERYYTLDRVKIQADGNDQYQVDIKDNNTNQWVNWYTFPPVSGGGLRTRDSGHLPPTYANSVRVYATHGDGKYSVSEVQLFANQAVPSCNGERVCGFSAPRSWHPTPARLPRTWP